jgi:hypothetical protein
MYGKWDAMPDDPLHAHTRLPIRPEYCDSRETTYRPHAMTLLGPQNSYLYIPIFRPVFSRRILKKAIPMSNQVFIMRQPLSSALMHFEKLHLSSITYTSAVMRI